MFELNNLRRGRHTTDEEQNINEIPHPQNTASSAQNVGRTQNRINQCVAERNQADTAETHRLQTLADLATLTTVGVEQLGTDIKVGLTTKEHGIRLRRFGYNQLKEQKENMLRKFFGFFWGPVQIVMISAIILAGALENWIDIGALSGLMILNAVIGFGQELRAKNTVDALKKNLALKATVLRDGMYTEVDVISLVPGDIVRLEEGSVIPADGKIVTPDGFIQVDQSSITGESIAVNKRCGDECPSSSIVKRGSLLMVVTNTGDSTFIGKSVALVQEAQKGVGHFTKVLQSISTRLLFLVVLTVVIILVVAFYRSLPWRTVGGYALAITIIGVPVGLPAVVTTTMAVGAAYLAKKKAIVQKLTAIESLAGVEILCTDKTGTLTRNILSIREIFLLRAEIEEEVMLAACLASNRQGDFRSMDAIDKMFMIALNDYQQAVRSIDDYQEQDFTPFDHENKRCIFVGALPDGERTTFIKGAPDSVLELVMRDNSFSPPAEDIRRYRERLDHDASQTLRSLGVARRRGDRTWELLGLVQIFDPPRYDTQTTLTEAKELGLSVKMLTGDSIGIAKQTCSQLGLGSNIYNAERLGLGTNFPDMSGSDLHDFVEAADGFAQVFPQHKYNVISMLQDRGYLVAMTGDGVNDAPSLKKADTGIAVAGACDAARSAADIVFQDSGLNTIIEAIKTSRQIFHRMYSYIVFRIALSIHLILFLSIDIIVHNRSLDTRLVVFIALFADIATLAIAYDKAPYSKTPVKWNPPKLWGTSTVLSVFLFAGTFITLSTMINHLDPVTGTVSGGLVSKFGNVDSTLFLQIVLTQNWTILITRTQGRSWSSLPSWQLLGAIFVVDVVATLMTLFGWLAPGGTRTDWQTVVKVYLIALGTMVVMAGVFYVCENAGWFDNLMHGRLRKPPTLEKKKPVEDLGLYLHKVSTQHDLNSDATLSQSVQGHTAQTAVVESSMVHPSDGVDDGSTTSGTTQALEDEPAPLPITIEFPRPQRDVM